MIKEHIWQEIASRHTTTKLDTNVASSFFPDSKTLLTRINNVLTDS